MKRKAEEFAAQLRTRIEKGEFGPSGGIPEASRLAEQYNLAPATVYKGLNQLVVGNILTKGATGFFVNSTEITLAEYVPPFHKAIEARGLTSFVENIDPITITTIPGETAILFGLPEGLQAVRRFRIQGELQEGKKVPHRMALYYYLIEAAHNYIQQLQDNPGLDLLVEIGPVEQRIHEKPIARLPSKEETSRLHITTTTPVMELQTTNRDTKGNVLLIQDIVFVASKVSLSYDYSIENRPKE